jgi:hypothetical protein
MPRINKYTYKSTKKNMVRFEDYWLEEWITIEITDRRRNRALTANPTSAEYGTSETDALRRITWSDWLGLWPLRTSTAIGTSDPTLDCLSRVTRLRVETQLGSRSMLMHYVDQLFKQDEIFRNRSHARAYNNTIELLLPESISNDCLRSFAKIMQAQLHLVAQVP